ncbi:binding-protein-dependent transport systems inner membrane component [Desulfonatronospira thiodismutans ASO3-1]|uniref:Binding-protein-dependent transport systems inner membrane component n=1 Tax=Desulfonatronospira thiodismutans ASO3-1 TaxID=555779 RepID=D6SL16_9BACT|nr:MULTISPECIES: ABC transporter permease [Desulfonatronospira]EFI35377.1 binding-protein-dependent transport systems inner membrane component [Desulfonatronospira thiodismutans ASO3-1]RQD75704.1 MAG: ABC transporter permease [Desulfonatronospira sp. MSAO_Bac3]
MDIINFTLNNAGLVLEYTFNHLSLVLIVLLISLALWISTGLIISWHDRLAGTVISLSNILFCIPSISLFGLFMTMPGFGLGRNTAVVVLVIYAMMPLVRSVYLGVKSVDASVVDAGKGMGMTPLQILLQIRIPMAWPMIFAGMRVSIVIVTGIATMATFIGEKNLGRLIHQGITRGDSDMIITGAIIVACMALLLDFIMARIQRRVISPGLRFDT